VAGTRVNIATGGTNVVVGTQIIEVEGTGKSSPTQYTGPIAGSGRFERRIYLMALSAVLGFANL